MKKSPTIRDVAQTAGVSVSVVSRVLNKGTGPVAPSTREKVIEAIEKLAYRPRAAARELNLSRPETIGLVLTDLGNPFFARLTDRVVWEARARGVQVMLMTTQEDPHLEAQLLETLRGRMVGGVIATPTANNSKRWRELRDLGIDVVFVDRAIPNFDDVDIVSIGNIESARVATTHLITLGHRRVGFISGPDNTTTGRSRVTGYRRALEDHGIPFDPLLVQCVPFYGETGADAANALLNVSPRPSALIVGNTAQVPIVVRRLAQSRVSIPKDLSLVVFDDNPWTELFSPPLTTIRQPIELLAMHSVELVLSRMMGNLPGTPQRIEVESEFVIRESCAQI